MSSFGELVLVVGDYHIPHRASKVPQAFRRMLVPNKMQHVVCTGNVSPEAYDELRSLAPNVHAVAGDYDGVDFGSVGGGGSDGKDENGDYYNNNGDTGNDMVGSVGGVIFPESRVLQVGEFRIGVIHGHQLAPYRSRSAIDRFRRRTRVDIVISGHTHQNEVTSFREGEGDADGGGAEGESKTDDAKAEAKQDGEDSFYYINPGSITGAYSSITEDVTPSFILLAVQGNKVVCYVYELTDAGEVEVSKTEFTKSSGGSSSSQNKKDPSSNPTLLASLLK